MLEDKIVKLRDMNLDLDPKQAKKLNIEQFTNLLAKLIDQQLIDGSETAKGVEMLIDQVFDGLSDVVKSRVLDKAALKAYRKSYNALIAKVKEVYNLVATGSLQSEYTGIGIAIGTGIGVALMAATNPAFMSIGTGIGIAIGAGIGAQKEKEAKADGRLF